MRLSEFEYSLPREFIAQGPLSERDRSKLLVLHRETGTIEHRRFYELPEYLEAGDLLVLNDTRVTARRLRGVKPSGGKVEALLLREVGTNKWEAIVKPGRRVRVGTTIDFGERALRAKVVDRTEDGGGVLDFGDRPGVADAVERVGEIPLPPYIWATLKEADRYQTIYAESPGSAAAPTAGLHFTPRLLAELHARGVKTVSIVLHIGIATFRPVRTEAIGDHVMHKETISISTDAAQAINSATRRIIAVGTTTARALESAAIAKRRVAAVDGETSLYIIPGYEFKILDGLITNFHMPKSTLLILVSAFAGRKTILSAYEEAKRWRYRFLSFGDAMLIL